MPSNVSGLVRRCVHSLWFEPTPDQVLVRPNRQQPLAIARSGESAGRDKIVVRTNQFTEADRLFARVGRWKYALSTCSIIMGGLLLSPVSASSQSTTDASNPVATVDPYQSDAWCSLPKSSVTDFMRRNSAAAGVKQHGAKRTRDRDEQEVGHLSTLAGAMGEIGEVRDALITGHLSINKPAGGVMVATVTYEITRDGEEKITTDFGGVTSLTIHHAGKTIMRFGSHIIPLSPTTMEDHQILVLPQWSILRHTSEQRFGVKPFGRNNGFQTAEILPPERPRAKEEELLPSTPTCVVYDPGTLSIARIERVVRAENHPTSEHRQSIVYSNYRVISGVPVPMKQVRFYDGILRDTLTIDTVQFNNHFAEAEFLWPAN